MVLVEDANGETFVIPEELLASLSQCAIDAAAAEVARAVVMILVSANFERLVLGFIETDFCKSEIA